MEELERQEQQPLLNGLNQHEGQADGTGRERIDSLKYQNDPENPLEWSK